MLNGNIEKINPQGSSSVRYKEENGNGGIKKEMNKEFQNARIPLEGIESLLNREKVPDSLGKRMDTKNIKENPPNPPNPSVVDDSMLSDLDDIISDAESIKEESRFSSNSNERKNERMRRRNKIVRNRDKNFFPKSKFGSSAREGVPRNVERNAAPAPEFEKSDTPNDDVSEIITDGEYHHQEVDEDEGDDVRSVSDKSDKSYSSDKSYDSGGESNSDFPDVGKKWKHPSQMSKDEIVSEKMDLLYRYGRLEGNGYKSGLNMNIRTPLETMRSEVHKLERMRNVQRSIRTQRKLLISFASGTEYVNKKYNPYKFALDGWSGEVLENIGDYDEVFEELHDKYKDSVEMAPELKLLTMVGGSGLMFHLSNTLFKSSTPQLNDILQKNPDIMAQIQREALNSMSASNAQDPIFGMMMQGVNEKKRQQEQQPQWNGRAGYAPPRTSGFTMPNPVASNQMSSVGTNVNQVPQGQGIVNQNVMSGPDGFDDILSQLNSGNMEQTGLISDVEEQSSQSHVKEVSTKQSRKRQNKKSKEVIDLDL